MRRERWVAVLVLGVVVLPGCSAFGGAPATPADTATAQGAAPPTHESTPTADSRGVATSTTEGADGDAETAGSSATAAPEETAAPDGTATPELTPMATLTPAALPTPSDGQSLPPGVHADGRVNETRVLVAHVAAANASNWRLRHTNGDSENRFYSVGQTKYRRDSEGVTWYRDGLTVTNRTYFGAPYEMRATHNTTLGVSDPTGTITLALAIRLSTSSYRWAGTTEVAGDRLHELRMTGPKGAGSTLGHYTGRLLLDERGRVHHLSGEVGENESVAAAYEYDYDWGVEAVPKPPWFDSVPRGVTEKTPDGTAVNVTMTGGPAVPAGSEFTVEHNGTEATVALDAALHPGESVFVGIREGEGERTVTVSREPPAGEDLVDLRGTRTRLSGTVTVDGVDVDLSFTVGQVDF